MFLPPGIHYDTPAAVYHADPCEVPSLSASIAKLMIEGAAIHAKQAHPRLSAVVEESDPTRPKEIGTAAHKLILGRGGDVIVIDANDYKKDEPKKDRKAIYASGKCAILKPDAETAKAMADATLIEIAGDPDLHGFMKAVPEVVVIAQDPSGAMLRIMIDNLELGDDYAVIWDVKTGEQSAAPEGLGKRIDNMGMQIQAELYKHVLALALPHLAGRITFRWLFVENEPPHLIVPTELDATGCEIGRRQMLYAIALWNQCMQSDEWPGYKRKGIVVAEFPTYSERRWLEREEAYAAAGLWPLVNGPTVERPPIKLVGPC